MMKYLIAELAMEGDRPCLHGRIMITTRVTMILADQVVEIAAFLKIFITVIGMITALLTARSTLRMSLFLILIVFIPHNIMIKY